MESTKEKRFYDALGIVPEVPEGIFEDVKRRTRRPNIVWRAALAACLAFAFIVPALVLTNMGPSAAAYADDTDMIAELFYAFGYLNGDFDDNYLFDDTEFTYFSEREFSDED